MSASRMTIAGSKIEVRHDWEVTGVQIEEIVLWEESWILASWGS